MTGLVESIFPNPFEDAPDLFLIHDLKGMISYVNRFVLKLLGYTPQEMLQKNLKDFISPTFSPNYARYLQIVAEKDYAQEVLCLLTRKKQERFLELNVVVCRRNNHDAQIRGVARDITERKCAEKALADVLGRFESIVRYTPLVAIQGFDSGGRIHHWNPVSEKLYGVSSRDVLEKPFHELFLGGQEAEWFTEDLKLVFEEGIPSEARECAIVTARGEKRWAYSSMFPVWGEDRCLEAIRMEIDITERKKAEERLEYLSIRDALTGLYNWGYFEEEMRRLDTSRFRPVSIIICDVDNLKPVNDFWGHKQGDVLLQATAKAISQPFRSSDVVARIGGDEFAIILPQSSVQIALQACERIKESLKQYNDSNPQFPLSISIGTSTSNTIEHSLLDTFREADRAMYCDKIKKVADFQQGIPRSLLSALSIFYARGFPLIYNDRAREMALIFGQKMGLELDDLGFLSIPHRPFPPQADYQENNLDYGLLQKKTNYIFSMLAIVNAYNIMINKHDYRKALLHEEAIAELRRCAGKQFDPVLVEKFIEFFG